MAIETFEKTKDWILGGLLAYLSTVATLAAYKIVTIDRVQTIHEYRISQIEGDMDKMKMDIARTQNKNEQQDITLLQLEAILPDSHQKKRNYNED